MIGEHCSDEDLLAYLDGDGETVDIRQHVEAGCDDCSSRLEMLREFTELLRDRTIHLFASGGHHRPRQADVFDLQTLTTRRMEEDAAAESMLNSLQAVSADEWLVKLPTRPRSAGFVRALIRRARAEYDRLPRRALRILTVADEVAAGLEAHHDVFEQRGVIAKTRAEALRMLGQHTRALELLDHAEAFLQQLPAPAYDLAFVDWVRAGVLFSTSRYAEALEVAQRAAKVFREFGDVESAEKLRMIQATILCEQGDVETAHRLFVRLLLFFGRRNDRDMIARLNANLAECEVRLDRADVAYEYAADAMRMYEELGYETEKVRIRWILGHALMRAGETHQALAELREASEEFERLGMTTDVALIGLDIAELHLSRGEWHDAEELTRGLATRFAAALAPIHTTRAFAYLREAVEANPQAKPLRELVDYLRSYLTVADVDDEPVPFDPPRM